MPLLTELNHVYLAPATNIPPLTGLRRNARRAKQMPPVAKFGQKVLYLKRWSGIKMRAAEGLDLVDYENANSWRQVVHLGRPRTGHGECRQFPRTGAGRADAGAKGH